jgi:hypothetical protein
MNTEKIYTPEIEAYATAVADALGAPTVTPSGEDKSFYEETCSHLPAEECKKIAFTLVADQATENFLQREEQEMMLNHAQMHDVLRNVIALSAVESLKRKGLIDTIEKDDGDEVIFLTTAGKELGKTLFVNNDEK